MKQDSIAALSIWMILTLFFANVVLYSLSFAVSDMVGASIFVIILWSYAISRTRKRAASQELRKSS